MWVGAALIVACWLVNLLVVSPAGNFPLNDDWIYSESVQHLLQTGQFHLLGCSPACFLHVAIGAAAAALFGFSHEHLRVLTCVLGLGTSLLFYGLLLHVGVRRAVASLASLLLAVNPLFVHLSYSFMTDVPALFFAMLSMFMMASGLKRNSAAFVAASGTALCAAILVRQTFAAFALVPIALLLFDRQRSNSFRLSLVVFGLLAPIAVAALAEQCMSRGNDFIAAYSWYKSQFAATVKHLALSPVQGGATLCERTFQIFCYFGLFCLPLVPFIVKTVGSPTNPLGSPASSLLRSWWAPFTLAAVIAVPSFVHTVFFEHRLMPFSDNLLRIPMIGPINLMGICIAGLKTRQKMWITCVGGVLALILMAALIRWVTDALASLRSGGREPASSGLPPAATMNVLAGAFLVAGLGTVVVQTIVLDYDRYYLMALPAVLICLSLLINRAHGKLLWTVSAVLCAGLAFYSTIACQDYMSWNQARWHAIAELERVGVPPLQIDGGPEYNYLANPSLVRACQLSAAGYVITNRGTKPYCDWRWWPISGERFLIAFNEVPGYNVVARTSFFGALTWSRRQILTLKREDRK